MFANLHLVMQYGWPSGLVYCSTSAFLTQPIKVVLCLRENSCDHIGALQHVTEVHSLAQGGVSSEPTLNSGLAFCGRVPCSTQETVASYVGFSPSAGDFTHTRTSSAVKAL